MIVVVISLLKILRSAGFRRGRLKSIGIFRIYVFVRPYNAEKNNICSEMGIVTVCSVIAERPRCRVHYFWPKVEDWNWETIFCGHYRSIFNHCDIIGLKIC